MAGMRTQTPVSPDRIGLFELFRSLPGAALADVRAAMRVERACKDTVICRQGERAERAYALAAGSVRILQTGSDGGQTILRFIGPDEMFGTVPLFTDHLFPADAIAAETSIIASWREQDLLRLIHLHPMIARNAIRVLGARMAQLQERVRELTTQRAEKRIAHAILRLAGQAGRGGAGGTRIEIPLRRKDLAAFAGTTLHTASRTVAAWEKAGLLTSGGQRLIVHDLAAFHALAEG